MPFDNCELKNIIVSMNGSIDPYDRILFDTMEDAENFYRYLSPYIACFLLGGNDDSPSPLNSNFMEFYGCKWVPVNIDNKKKKIKNEKRFLK